MGIIVFQVSLHQLVTVLRDTTARWQLLIRTRSVSLMETTAGLVTIAHWVLAAQSLARSAHSSMILDEAQLTSVSTVLEATIVIPRDRLRLQVSSRVLISVGTSVFITEALDTCWDLNHNCIDILMGNIPQNLRNSLPFYSINSWKAVVPVWF